MPSRAMRSAESPAISRSSKRMAPALGARSPDSMLMSVVLPAPLGPITACTSPRRSSSETSLTAARPPNCLESSVTRRIGSVIGDLGRAAALAQREPADAARQQQHRENDQHPHGQQPMLVEAVEDRLVGQKILQQREREGAEDRAEERADAAEDHHHQDAA